MSSIRQGLTRTLVIGATVLLAAGGTGVYVLTRAALMKQFDGALRTKALAIAGLTQQDEDGVSIDMTAAFMRDLGRPDAADVFEMQRLDTGTLVGRSTALGSAHLPQRAGTEDAPTTWDVMLPSGAAARAIAFTFVPHLTIEEREDKKALARARALLVVACDRRDLDRTLHILAAVLASTGTLMLIAALVMLPRALKRGLGPLDRLAERAAGITADSLATRFESTGMPDELRPISARLNDVLARLERSFERERQFSGDLAHELRTPIAELRSLSELALKWPDTREPGTDRHALLIAVQMEGIVNRLLALLRSERGQLAVTREAVSLEMFVQSAWTPFAEQAAAKRIEAAIAVGPGPVVHTDPVLLRSILLNLIENAVEYAPEGTRVDVEALVAAGRLEVRVSNLAPGLTTPDLSRLFERFWRRDAARSGGEHSGLGLSLARAFAIAIGCSLTASLTGGPRLTLTLTGPAAPPTPAASTRTEDS
jgi:two-component system sensor histidine kinase QseC